MRLIDFCHHICHQLPERSFLRLWDPPLLCARCTGFYLGVVAGIVVLCAARRNPADKAAKMLVVALMLTAAEIGMEKLQLFDPGNYVRSATGLLLGCAIGIGLFSPFKTLWIRRNNNH